MEEIKQDYEPMYGKSRVGFEAGRIGRVKVSPAELAAYNLYKTLEKYPEFTKEGRHAIQNEFANLPGLETMNLEVFASVLTFLKTNQPTPETFKTANIEQYFTRLYPTKTISIEDKKQLTTKLKSLFLKYIIAITAYRSSLDEAIYENEEEIEEEQYESE